MRRTVVGSLLCALVMTACASSPHKSRKAQVDPYEVEIRESEKAAEEWRNSGNEVMSNYFEQKAHDAQSRQAEQNADLFGLVIDILIDE